MNERARDPDDETSGRSPAGEGRGGSGLLVGDGPEDVDDAPADDDVERFRFMYPSRYGELLRTYGLDPSPIDLDD